MAAFSYQAIAGGGSLANWEKHLELWVVAAEFCHVVTDFVGLGGVDLSQMLLW